MPRLLVVLLLSLITGLCSAGLYSPGDPLTILDHDNFESTVLGSDQAWIVEFYASWCGHCQRLAPMWKAFGRNVRGWTRVVRVGAVACSDAANAQLCRDNEVWGFPTVKLYPPNGAADFRGHKYNGAKSVAALTDATIDYLIGLEESAVSGAQWPRLRHYGSNADVISKNQNSNHRIVITQNDEGKLAQKVILDMSDLFPALVVAGRNVSDTDQPRVYQLFRNEEISTLEYEIVRRSLAENLRFFVTHIAASTSTSAPATTLRPSDVGLVADGLHMQDLESSIYYSFWVEIGGHSLIAGDKLTTLKNHVNMLSKYHPGDSHVRIFLNRTQYWLRQQRESLTGQQWIEALDSMLDERGYIPHRVEWTGCHGSESHFRGYPCSLWMTFHALTVSAYLKEGQDPDFRPIEILQNMREYIRHFLGCRHCAENFINHTPDIASELSVSRDGVLWLWQAHNKVNNVLRDDPTEDPLHPKIQFPALDACSNCRRVSENANNTNWRMNKIMAYLLRYYGEEHIIRDAMPYNFANDRQTPTPATGSHVTARPTCVPIATPWSTCSQSCSVGVSSRLSNAHASDCQVVMEFRLCFIRPCNALFGDVSTAIPYSGPHRNPASKQYVPPDGSSPASGFHLGQSVPLAVADTFRGTVSNVLQYIELFMHGER